MVYRARIHYTDEMKSCMWDRYQQGYAVKAIARSFDRSSSSIHGQLARTGGIRPLERKRSPRSRSLSENAKKSPEGLLLACLCAQELPSQIERPLQSAERSVATAAVATIERLRPIKMRGIRD